jgi:hypothetical protein
MRNRCVVMVLASLFLFFILSEILNAQQTQSTSEKRVIKKDLKTAPGVNAPATTPSTRAPAATRTVPKAAKERPLGKLTIVRPASGDHFFQGDEVVIEWSKEGEVPEKCCRISLFKDNEEVVQITQKVCVNGYRWKIPEDLWGPSFTVKVMTIDGKVSAQSSSFPINAAKADLTVGKVTATPVKLRAGEEVTIRARIDNTGNTKSEPQKAFVIKGSWWNTWGNVKRTEYQVPALSFGDHTYITHKETLIPGDWMFGVIVGKVSLPGFGDKFAPDEKYVWVSVYGDTLPDLVVCTYTTLYGVQDPPDHQPGSYAWIRAAIYNAGAMPAGPTKTRVLVDRVGSFEFDVPPLKKDEQHKINKVVKLADNAEARFRVEVDKGKYWTELSETNNTIHGKIIVKQHGEELPGLTTYCSDGKQRSPRYP